MRDSFGFFLTAEGAEGAEEEKRERERTYANNPVSERNPV
jgi:hypothetical protein